VRMQKSFFTSRARFAIIVNDDWQHRGIGTRLLTQLVSVARAEGLQLLRAAFLPENGEMRALCEKQGFTVARTMEDEPMYAELVLRPETIFPGPDLA